MKKAQIICRWPRITAGDGRMIAEVANAVLPAEWIGLEVDASRRQAALPEGHKLVVPDLLA